MPLNYKFCYLLTHIHYLYILIFLYKIFIYIVNNYIILYSTIQVFNHLGALFIHICKMFSTNYITCTYYPVQIVTSGTCISLSSMRFSM